MSGSILPLISVVQPSLLQSHQQQSQEGKDSDESVELDLESLFGAEDETTSKSIFCTKPTETKQPSSSSAVGTVGVGASINGTSGSGSGGGGTSIKVPVNLSAFETARQLERQPEAKQLKQAVQCYKLAAESGDLPSMLRMAYFYFTGLFDPRTGDDIIRVDPAMAIDLCNKVIAIASKPVRNCFDDDWIPLHPELLSKANSMLHIHVADCKVDFPVRPDPILLATFDHGKSLCGCDVSQYDMTVGRTMQQYECLQRRRIYFDQLMSEAIAGDAQAQFICGKHMIEDSITQRCCWHLPRTTLYSSLEEIDAAYSKSTIKDCTGTAMVSGNDDDVVASDVADATADNMCSWMEEVEKFQQFQLQVSEWKKMGKEMLYKSARQGNAQARGAAAPL